MPEINKPWNIPNDIGVVHVPDELDGLINLVVTQLRLHKISGKNEAQTVCDIVYLAEQYFKT